MILYALLNSVAATVRRSLSEEEADPFDDEGKGKAGIGEFGPVDQEGSFVLLHQLLELVLLLGPGDAVVDGALVLGVEAPEGAVLLFSHIIIVTRLANAKTHIR